MGCTLAVLALVWASPTPESGRHVTIYAHGKRISAVTLARTAEDAVIQAGIQLDPDDLVLPSTKSPPTDGASIVVVSTRKVALSVAGTNTTLLTMSDVVSDVLEQAGVELGPLDKVEPSLNTRIHPGQVITVHRITQKLVTRQVEVPFETERRPDPTLDGGVVKPIQEGQPGTDEITDQITYQDGQPIDSKQISAQRLLEPVTAVLAYGVLNTVSRGGVDYHYTQSFDMTASGYTAGKESNPNGNGYTATGLYARRGVVAVDPSVIPLYSRLYIEGYGPAIAADTGGAIKGNRIDLCFDSLEEALDWGMRDVKVYILSN